MAPKVPLLSAPPWRLRAQTVTLLGVAGDFVASHAVAVCEGTCNSSGDQPTEHAGCTSNLLVDSAACMHGPESPHAHMATSDGEPHVGRMHGHQHAEAEEEEVSDISAASSAPASPTRPHGNGRAAPGAADKPAALGFDPDVEFFGPGLLTHAASTAGVPRAPAAEPHAAAGVVNSLASDSTAPNGAQQSFSSESMKKRSVVFAADIASSLQGQPAVPSGQGSMRGHGDKSGANAPKRGSSVERQDSVDASGLVRRMSSSLLRATMPAKFEEASAGLCQRSLMVLPKASFPRKQCIQLVTLKAFDWLMLAAILANCVFLALDSNRPGFEDSAQGKGTAVANRVFMAVFTMEAVVKIIAWGFLWAPNTYLRDAWNGLDFLVVIMGFVELGLQGSNISALRSIRVLRPLRTITKIEKMKVIVTTLLKSIPMLIDVAFLAAFYFAIFGVLTLSLFSGKLEGRCGEPDMSAAVPAGVPDAQGFQVLQNVSYTFPDDQTGDVCAGPLSDSVTWLLSADGVNITAADYDESGAGRWCDWAPSADHPLGLWCAPYGNPGLGFRSFDNILYSWLSIFQALTMTDWVFMMYDTQDGVSGGTWPLFVVMVVFGPFFIINLMLAVLYLQFSKDREAAEDAAEEERQHNGEAPEEASSVMHRPGDTDSDEDDDERDQRAPGDDLVLANGVDLGEDGKPGPVSSKRMQLQQQQSRRANAAAMWLRVRQWCFDLQANPHATNFTTGVIVLNAIVMGLTWYPVQPTVDDVTGYLNYSFTSYFAIEMAVKLTGLGPKQYVSDRMNIFDGLVTVASMIEMAIDISPLTSSLGSTLSVLRGLRLLRLFRLARKWRNLRRIITTLLMSASSVAYLTLLLLLFMFICALLGMQLFGYKMDICDTVEGSVQLCPPGLSVEECPSHFDCYVACTAEQLDTWIDVDGSPYGGKALCEVFPRTAASEGSPQEQAQYWAQVGRPTNPRAHFDTFWQAYVTVFQVLTFDNWADVLHNAMQATSPWCALYFVCIIAIGNYMVLNLFLAILLDNFSLVSEQMGASEPSASASASRMGAEGSSRPQSAGEGEGSRRSAYEDEEDGEEQGLDPASDREQALQKHLNRMKSMKKIMTFTSSFYVPSKAVPKDEDERGPGGVAANPPPKHVGLASPSERREMLAAGGVVPQEHQRWRGHDPEEGDPMDLITPMPSSTQHAGNAPGSSALLQQQLVQPQEAGTSDDARMAGSAVGVSRSGPMAEGRGGLDGMVHPSCRDDEEPVAVVDAFMAAHGGAPDASRAAPQQQWPGQHASRFAGAPEQQQQQQQDAISKARPASQPASWDNWEVVEAGEDMLMRLAPPSVHAEHGMHAGRPSAAQLMHPPHTASQQQQQQQQQHLHVRSSPTIPESPHIRHVVRTGSEPVHGERGLATSPAPSAGAVARYPTSPLLHNPTSPGSSTSASPSHLSPGGGHRRGGELELEEHHLLHLAPPTSSAVAASPRGLATLLSAAPPPPPQPPLAPAPAPPPPMSLLVQGPVGEGIEEQMALPGSAEPSGNAAEAEVQSRNGSTSTTGGRDARAPSILKPALAPGTVTPNASAPPQATARRKKSMRFAEDTVDHHALMASVEAAGQAHGHAQPGAGGSRPGSRRSSVVNPSAGPSAASSAGGASDWGNGATPIWVAAAAHHAEADVRSLASHGITRFASATSFEASAAANGGRQQLVDTVPVITRMASFFMGARQGGSHDHAGLLQGAAAVLAKMRGDQASAGGGVEAAGEHDKDHDASVRGSAFSMVKRLNSVVMHPNSVYPVTQEMKKFRMRDILRGRSLGLFGPDNPVRLAAAHIVMHKRFEHFMLFMIMASSLVLTVDTVDVEDGSTLRSVLHIMDIVFTVTFGIEAAIKILVSGLLLNGKGSYLRSPWNVLDMFVVAVGVAVLVVESLGMSRSNIVWLRAVRALRALRPLRAASRAQGIRVVVTALFKAIPALGNVLLVAGLFYYIFAVLAINLLQGAMSYCQDTSSGDPLDPYYVVPQDASWGIDADWCKAAQEAGVLTVNASEYHSTLTPSQPVPAWNTTVRWRTPFTRFDNVAVASWTLFQIATLEMWSDIMYAAMDAVGPGQQPVRDTNTGIAIFFIVFVVIGSFFLLNLIIGVSIDKFNAMKSQTGGASPLLTPEQEQWLTIQKLMAATRLQTKYTPPTHSSLRMAFYSLAMHPTFDVCMMGVIMASIVCMCLTHAGEDNAWEVALSAANIGFTATFLLEVVIKWTAVGLRQYFSDRWNTFDFAVVLVSIAGVVVDYATSANLTFMPLLRILRVARIFRLIPKAKGLRMMLQTIVWSLPALINVGSVLVLFMFIFAIVGMNLWGNILEQDNLTRHAHFRNFPSAMLLLFRMMTGENWNGVMWDCMIRESCMELDADTVVYVTADDAARPSFPGVPAPGNATAASGLLPMLLAAGTLLDPGDSLLSQVPDGDVNNRCSPAPVLAALYFCCYILVVALLLLQLVIGIILDNIQSTSFQESLTVSQSHINQFVETWEELDPYATSYIPVICLTPLLMGVDTPLGVRGQDNTRMHIQEIIMETEIPNRSNRVHFLEVLHALASRVAGAALPVEEEFRIHDHLIARLPKEVELPKYSAAHFYAAMYVQGAVRGFMARHALQPLWAAATASEKTAAEAAAAAAGGRATSKHERQQQQAERAVSRARSIVHDLRKSIAAQAEAQAHQWEAAVEAVMAERRLEHEETQRRLAAAGKQKARMWGAAARVLGLGGSVKRPGANAVVPVTADPGHAAAPR